MSRVSKEMRDELRNEISLLMQLDHPNIVRLLWFWCLLYTCCVCTL